MKKLLIATMAAVSVGLCAKADDASTFPENGTSFDDLTTGADFVGDNNFWQTPEGEGDLFKIIDVVYPQDATPQHWNLTTGEKALSIDTANPILRNVNALNTDVNPPVHPAQPVTKPIFFDSVVQFTATDVAPSMENNTADKLMVWLYATPEGTEGRLFGEDDAITNLVITAGYYDGYGNRSYTNYLTNVAIQPDTWHRLTIKAINDIGIHNLPTPGFEVYVDGNKNPVSGKCDYDGENPTLVTEFPSLIARNNSGVNYLQGVAFDGKGAVDDIVFTTTAPDFTKAPSEPTVETYTLSIVGENFTYEVYTDSEWGDKVTDLTAINTEYKTLWLGITPTENYELESIKLGNQTIELPEYNEEDKVYYLDELQISTGDIDNGAEFTLTITMKEKTGGGSGEEPEDPEDPEVPAKPTIGGAPVETAEAFIAAANSGATIKVPADWTLVDNTLKDADGVAYATFADYYTVTLASDGTGTITLKLNNKAEPTIDETAADKGDAIVVTDEEVALGVTNAKVGLWYGAQAYSDAACTTKVGDVTGWEKAEGTTVTVTATKPEGDKAFFKVVVDDQDHTPPAEGQE